MKFKDFIYLYISKYRTMEQEDNKTVIKAFKLYTDEKGCMHTLRNGKRTGQRCCRRVKGETKYCKHHQDTETREWKLTPMPHEIKNNRVQQLTYRLRSLVKCINKLKDEQQQQNQGEIESLA